MVINKHTLSNGLTIVHSPDKNTKMVAVNMLYKVGSRNESESMTGFAHLFEHLMFGGSINIPDYDTPLQLACGENNAFTTCDYTNYYITLPSANIETAFWLESDRMLSLAFTPESLEVQRNVVMEEFKQHYLNQPYGDLSHIMAAMAYKRHPYRWPTIGLKLDHIKDAKMEDVKDFFQQHYRPDNAILSVVGNIGFEETISLTEKWFGEIEKRTSNLKTRAVINDFIPEEPEQKRQRRKTVYRNVPNDLLYMSFTICKRTDKDFHACDMISDILANGRSSRLYRKLVEQEKLFTSLDAYISARTDKGQLFIVGMPAEGININDAEAAIWKEIDNLRHETASSEELDKLKNKYEANDSLEKTDYQHRAAQLAYFEMYGDAAMIDNEVENYRAVTPEMLKKACGKYLLKKNSCILHYLARNNT